MDDFAHPEDELDAAVPLNLGDDDGDPTEVGLGGDMTEEEELDAAGLSIKEDEEDEFPGL